MIWLVFALMTAAALAAGLWPLLRRRAAAPADELAVYRDQLKEIERDRALGLIGEREAEAARIEVSRRLIAAANASAPALPAPLARRVRALAAALLLVFPAAAAAFYLALGSPHVPGQPHAARVAAAQREQPGAQDQSLAELVARVEAHLQRNPDDGRGWEVLAPVYMKLGRYGDAAKARGNAVRLLGTSAEREADHGEALVAAADGVVTAEARAAFERALALEPHNVLARYYSGLAAEQDGRAAQAAEIWRSLLRAAPADAPWAPHVRAALARVDPAAVAGPTAEDIAELAPEQRAQMVRGMVERLAARLKREGTDLEGWLRLVRAYLVLGERAQARAAAEEARRALAREPDKLRRLEEMVRGLGLDG